MLELCWLIMTSKSSSESPEVQFSSCFHSQTCWTIWFANATTCEVLHRNRHSPSLSLKKSCQSQPWMTALVEAGIEVCVFLHKRDRELGQGSLKARHWNKIRVYGSVKCQCVCVWVGGWVRSSSVDMRALNSSYPYRHTHPHTPTSLAAGHDISGQFQPDDAEEERVMTESLIPHFDLIHICPPLIVGEPRSALC